MPNNDAFPVHEPAWVTHAIWWHVYPLGFVGAPQTAQDDGGHANGFERPDRSDRPDGFEQLAGWLDYAVELGASGILLGPIFASETHGYDTVDYFRIDPRLGDEDDLRALIAAAHDRGIKVVLDGVFNHVGRGFEPFRRALADPADPASSWFRVVEQATDAAAPVFATFESHDALVALNHDEPAVAEFVVDVMAHWLDAGIDGWRLDAAYAVPPAFWAGVLPRVRERHPDAFFVGEVIHGDYSAIVAESQLDSVTQYETWKAIWSGIDDSNLFELEHAIGRHDGYLDAFVPMTFVGNHDVTRIATAIPDERHLAHALVVLFTIGGTPSIYYGDEQGFRGVKEERAGGDDAIRPQFPADRSSLSPEGWPMFHLHQELIGLRRRHPWLHRATTSTIELSNTAYVYEVRAGSERLIVALNIGDADAAADVPAAGGPAAGAVLAGAASVDGGRITVPAHGWAVLAVD